MSESSIKTREFGAEYVRSELATEAPRAAPVAPILKVAPIVAPEVPAYLNDVYWWAYVHPNAIRVFERQWLVNAILWGNYRLLRDAAMDALGQALPGRTLQIGCAYGDVTRTLWGRAKAGGGRLDVVDVLPTQLENLRKKLPMDASVGRLLMDSAALKIADGSVDRVMLFLLLHEQPDAWRRKTIAEALRVLKPGGRIVLVDYAQPRWWNPMRYLFAPILNKLEPFALELWRKDITTWIPEPWASRTWERRSYFGGLYQFIVIER